MNLIDRALSGYDEAMNEPPQAPSVPVPDVTPLTQPAGRTDATNARRLVAKFGDVIRWVGPWDRWLIWDGRRWKVDQALQIEALAKKIGADLWREIGEHVAHGNIDKDTLASMASFAKASNSNSGIRNMVALARSEPGVPISQDELDADPWLLNVANGTIDLRTGELREHRREDFLTKLAPVAFAPNAKCPRWGRFLKIIFAGNQQLIGYMQRLVGYTLTGVTEEHILPFCHGTGANGKSTKVETLLKMMGPDYAMKAPPDLLMAKHGETHPTERADLFGKRFVACVESAEGRRLAETLVKELTGGDRVRARRMREDFWEFSPTHHVWLVSNHKPTVIGTDLGIWRRIKLIPFDVVIPEAEQDKKIGAKLTRELPGILNWALQGCLEWQRRGMQEPAIVKAATEEYSAEMDEIGLFIDEHCELGPALVAPATALYEAFVEKTGSRLRQQTFGERLRQRGFEKGRITKGVLKAKHCWKGLRLRSDAAAEKLLACLNSKKRRKP